MAEIRVQPKKGSLTWLWVLLLLVIIAAAVWYFYFRNAAPMPATVGAMPTTGAIAHSAPHLARRLS